MKKFILCILFMSFLIQPVFAETFSWPTTGWIGYRYKDQTTYCTGNCHTGVDIWSNKDGGWNGGIFGSSNPIYPAYPGTLIWEGDVGFIIKHSSTLYTNYFHVRNRQVHPTIAVNQNTLLGYQDADRGVVHLHITVSATSSDSGNIDPSPYFGLQLDIEKPNVIGFLTNYVQKSTACGGTNVVLTNAIMSNGDCAASNSITINPESNITGSFNFHIP